MHQQKSLNDLLGGVDVDIFKSEMCKREFYFFLQEFWNEIIHEIPIYNWHIKFICDELQEIAIRIKERKPSLFEYYIINVPPASSKSTIISQMFTAWCWTIDPTQRFICASYSQTISRKDASFFQLIINSDKYKKYFPEIGLNKDAVDLIKNSKGGERFATSVGGSVTGQHAHCIIIDDPLNPQQSTSEAERNNANAWMIGTLPTRKVDPLLTPTIIVMQRLHENDVTGFILDRVKNVKHICLPAELDSNIRPLAVAKNYVDGLLDVKRLSKEILNQRKITLGSYGYAGQMLQNPAPSEGGIFKKQWFKIIDSTSVPHIKTDFVIDTAYTSNEKNDPTGMLSYIISGNNLYITNFKKGHWEFLDQCKQLVEFVKENNYTRNSIIEVEPKASGKDVVNTLKKQTDLNIKEAINPTRDKEARANDIAPYVEAERVYLVRGGWNDDFIIQLATFPNARNDEEVDCLVMACHRAFKKKKVIRM